MDKMIKRILSEKIAIHVQKNRNKPKIHGNVKCDCGHRQKDHYQNRGFCHHSEHPKAGQCGCTWFHPNVNYIKRKNKTK